MLALPGCGPIGLGNHVQRQELGQDLGVQRVALPCRFGDDAELLGMGQHDPPRHGLDQTDEPLVAGGGFDDGLELSEFLEAASEGVFIGAQQPVAFDDLAGWVHDADRDRLFVQVAAGEQHGVLLVVETGKTTLHVYHVPKHTPSRLGLLIASPPDCHPHRPPDGFSVSLHPVADAIAEVSSHVRIPEKGRLPATARWVETQPT
jgi:hypothetical protein